MLVIIISVLILCYIFARLSLGINRSATCLNGKTAVITGANSGLGYQTALNLASRGCRIIMADIADMEDSKMNIIKYTNNSNVITKKLDLSSLQSVRDFAADIVKTEERLDILINNAGIGAATVNRTKDGLHPLMQINYFGHFLLTHLLVDLLKKSAPSRVVFTSSFLAFTNNLKIDNLNFNEENAHGLAKVYQIVPIYGNSKLATIIASDLFARKLERSGITVNSVHPGLVSTTIFNKVYGIVDVKWLQFITQSIISIFSKTPWEGSQTIVKAAVSKKYERITGEFLLDCKPFYKPLKAYNENFCREIWKASEKFVGLRNDEKL